MPLYTSLEALLTPGLTPRSRALRPTLGLPLSAIDVHWGALRRFYVFEANSYASFDAVTDCVPGREGAC